MGNEQEPLAVAIVGAGGMGRRHGDCWRQVPGATIVAVVDRKVEKAERLADTVRGERPQVFADVDDLLASAKAGGPVAASLCLPTAAHRPVAEALLGAGMHVLCEKPMALTVADCEAMTAAARTAGRLLGVAQVVRFFPEYAQAKELVAAGAVGQPAAVRTRRGGDFPRADTDWYADVSRSGGVIFDLLIHDIDWAQWCFGPIVRVYAQGLTERLAAGTVDHLDYALLTCRHASGAISHLEGTWADPGGFATAFEIAGDAGLLTHDSRTACSVRGTTRALAAGTPVRVTAPPSPLAAEDNPYLRQIAAFAAAVRGQAPLAVTPEEASSAVVVATAARESLAAGRAVEIGAGE